MWDAQLEVFSTCPQWNGGQREHFLRSVADSARWSEQYGCKGILVYSDNSQIDPWLVSQMILHNSHDLCALLNCQWKNPTTRTMTPSKDIGAGGLESKVISCNSRLGRSASATKK
jgi:hypothetical protein